MINLSQQDQKRLIQILILVPVLKNEKGREAVLISAGLDKLLTQFDLGGPPAVAIPILVSFLCKFGRLDYEQEALGRFLSTIKDYVGIEEQEFLDQIIRSYGLMVPMARSTDYVDWAISLPSKDILEKIIGENTLRPVAFLQKGLESARSVVYIEVTSMAKKWSGTGFMISPGMLVTNHHVLPDQQLLANSIFRFNYQLDTKGNPEVFQDYIAAENGIYLPDKDLDYALVELDGTPGVQWGYLSLKLEIPAPDTRVNIIQHPNGFPKQIALQNNFVKYADAKKIHYVTSTLPGSSGSPVLNNDWKVIGLHHAGGWLPESEGGPLYFRNEGITIKAIVDHLPKEIRSHLSYV